MYLKLNTSYAKRTFIIILDFTKKFILFPKHFRIYWQAQKMPHLSSDKLFISHFFDLLFRLHWVPQIIPNGKCLILTKFFVSTVSHIQNGVLTPQRAPVASVKIKSRLDSNLFFSFWRWKISGKWIKSKKGVVLNSLDFYKAQTLWCVTWCVFPKYFAIL